MRDRSFSDLLDRFARFSAVRASIENKQRTDPEDIMSALLQADQDLASWPAALPSEYSYTRVASCPAIQAYAECCDTYQSMRAAVLWCGYRCMRALIYKMILDNCFRRLSEVGGSRNIPDHDPRCASIESTMADLCAEVCAVVPYLLKCTIDRPNDVIKPTTVGAGSLMWPFYVVASTTDGMSNYVFQWVRRRILNIAEATGTQQATVMASLLTSRVDINNWKIGMY